MCASDRMDLWLVGALVVWERASPSFGSRRCRAAGQPSAEPPAPTCQGDDNQHDQPCTDQTPSHGRHSQESESVDGTVGEAWGNPVRVSEQRLVHLLNELA